MQDSAPLANSNGLLWNLDDPSQPARLASGRREPVNVNRAFREYLEQGPGRFAQRLPGRHETWARNYAWRERARHHDALCAQNLQTEQAARQRTILTQGVASAVERVAELKQIYAALKDEMADAGHIWLVDVRYQRVEANQFERVETLRFNAPLFQLARGVLADLARETGGRQAGSLPGEAPAGGKPLPWAQLSGLSRAEMDTLEKVMKLLGLDEELFP